MKEKPVSQSVLPWLRENLGARCLAPLTGTDARALAAAVHVVELYSYSPSQAAVEAFQRVVSQMQVTTRELAYHAIAHVMDWRDRQRLWTLAELAPLNPCRCKHEP